MSLRRALVCFVLPLFSLLAYFVVVICLSEGTRGFFLSELGPIEMATALMFFGSAGVAIRLVVQGRDLVPTRFRVLYVLFAVAALFVGLEELSYGQHLVGWDSPDYFQQANKQAETNLHNLAGSKPSRRIRSLANAGFPLVMIVLPAVALMQRGSYRRDHPSFYFLPKAELMGLALLAAFVTVVNRGAETEIGRLGELKEFYWAATALAYICLLRSRIIGQASEADGP